MWEWSFFQTLIKYILQLYRVFVVNTFSVSLVVLVPIGLGQSGWSVCLQSNEGTLDAASKKKGIIYNETVQNLLSSEFMYAAPVSFDHSEQLSDPSYILMDTCRNVSLWSVNPVLIYKNTLGGAESPFFSHSQCPWILKSGILFWSNKISRSICYELQKNSCYDEYLRIIISPNLVVLSSPAAASVFFSPLQTVDDSESKVCSCSLKLIMKLSWHQTVQTNLSSEILNYILYYFLYSLCRVTCSSGGFLVEDEGPVGLDLSVFLFCWLVPDGMSSGGRGRGLGTAFTWDDRSILED